MIAPRGRGPRSEGKFFFFSSQSRTLDIFFERPEAIATEIDLTDEGIIVVQTSEDPEMVTALAMSMRKKSPTWARTGGGGMQAVHEKMMQGG